MLFVAGLAYQVLDAVRLLIRCVSLSTSLRAMGRRTVIVEDTHDAPWWGFVVGAQKEPHRSGVPSSRGGEQRLSSGSALISSPHQRQP